VTPDMEWLIRQERRIRPDGDQVWWQRVQAKLAECVRRYPDALVADVGCGADSGYTSVPAHAAALRVGLDVDPDGARNPAIDRFVRASADAIPLRSGSVDLVVSGYVLEHLRDPRCALREFARVLKPGGAVVLWTPNRLNYAIAVSALTPTWFHNWVRRLGDPGLSKDNCPTFYRLNTAGALARGIEEAGLVLAEPPIHTSGAYLYFRFSKTLFTLAALASRVARHTPLRHLKAGLIAVCTKPGAVQASRAPASPL